MAKGMRSVKGAPQFVDQYSSKPAPTGLTSRIDHAAESQSTAAPNFFLVRRGERLHPHEAALDGLKADIHSGHLFCSDKTATLESVELFGIQHRNILDLLAPDVLVTG
jgi:hypothetical protein